MPGMKDTMITMTITTWMLRSMFGTTRARPYPINVMLRTHAAAPTTLKIAKRL
jgi:hypothetical protein